MTQRIKIITFDSQSLNRYFRLGHPSVKSGASHSAVIFGSNSIA